MIRFTRRTVIRNAAYVPKAISFATELSGHFNKKYSTELHFGVELFGTNTMTWYLDVPDLARLEAINARLLEDKDYWKMLESVRDLWLDGSLQDTVVNIVR